MKYRAEIDGLRALAVIPVILFHAGFEWFSGGFVGVDVFFVISGYLITTILIEEIEKNRFSIVHFYERRARRILPALFFIMLLCLPFAWMWMLPFQMKDFSQSLVAVSLFASNILFWSESDYFAPDAEDKPLLHTWSLAVEEQYYVLFPIFLILTWRFGKHRVFWAIVAIASLSLLLSEWGWRNDPTTNFYLIPTRAWELFAGSIAAFIVQKNGVQKNNVLALLGLTAILFSIFAYDETIPFPSVYALVPVLGVVFIILFADKTTLTAQLLSTKIFVGVGLVSYSAYLWHQPLFAFARIRTIGDVAPSLMALLSLASIVLAIASWRFVEQPFRKGSFSRKWIFGVSGVFILVFIALGVLGHKTQGFANRFHGDMRVIQSATKSENPYREICRIDTMGEITHVNMDCWYGNVDDSTLNILYWGDSHTDATAYELHRTMPEASIYHAAYASCPPVLGLVRQDSVSECDQFNEKIYTFLAEQHFDVVILSARWRAHFTGQKFNNGQGATENYQVIYDTVDDSKLDTREGRVANATIEFVTKLAGKYPNTKFVVLGQIPEAGWNVPVYVAKKFLKDGVIPNVSIDRSHIEMQSAIVAKTFKELEQENVFYFEVLDVFCDQSQCHHNFGRDLIYKDDDHLTVFGANMLATELKNVLTNLQ